MTLHGVVTWGGEPVEGAYVRLLGPSGDFTAEIRTKQSGDFTFHPVTGRWRLRVMAPGHLPAQREVEVQDGEDIEVDIPL